MALDWIPRYPDWLPYRFRPMPWAFTPEPILPIPRPAPPTFSAFASFPPTASRRVLARMLQPTVTAPIPATYVLSPVLARAIYPDLTRRLPLLAALQSPGLYPFSVLSAIPVTQSWRPRYPDQIWRTRPTATGTSVWVVDPTTLLNAAACLVWHDTALVRPALITETVPDIDMTGEGLSQPSFVRAEMCDGMLNRAETFLPNILVGMNLRWLPIYPSQTWRPPLLVAQYPCFFWRPFN